MRAKNWRTRRLLLFFSLMAGLSVAASAAPASSKPESGKYAVTVLDGGFVYQFTWTLRVTTAGAISGTSVGSGYTDPLTGQGTTIVRHCGPAARAQFKGCSNQTYVVRSGARGVLKGTATGFGIVAGTTFTMRLASPATTTTSPTKPSTLPPLPSPDQKDATGRMQSIKPVDGTGRTSVIVNRGGTLYEASENSVLQTGDKVKTDSNTILAIEFLIGGRVGVNKSTEIVMVNERSVADGETSLKRLVLKNGSLWLKADAKQLKQPIEIQTNGGTMGIRG